MEKEKNKQMKEKSNVRNMFKVMLHPEKSCYVSGKDSESELQDIIGQYVEILKKRNPDIPVTLKAPSLNYITFEKELDDAYDIIVDAANNGDIDAEHTLIKIKDVLKDFPNYFVIQSSFDANMWYAKHGDVYAQGMLGDKYFNGIGVEKNFEEAVKWYRKSAEQGTAEGQWRLGQCYRYARGVQRNIREALFWYKKAAEQGHEKAADVYSLLKDSNYEIYIDGCKLLENKEYKEAYDVFYSISSDAWGQNGLAFCFAQGLFVEKKYWFQKAARQGLAVAQYNLALCYYLGKGIRTDKALASYWKGKAVEQGFTPAKVLESWEKTPFYKSLGIESFNFESTLKNLSFLLKDDKL